MAFLPCAGRRVHGRKLFLGQNVNIGANVRMGKGVKVQNNVSVYEEWRRLCVLRAFLVFTNDLTPGANIPKDGRDIKDAGAGRRQYRSQRNHRLRTYHRALGHDCVRGCGDKRRPGSRPDGGSPLRGSGAQYVNAGRFWKMTLLPRLRRKYRQADRDRGGFRRGGMAMQFSDLHAQYRALQQEIDENIRRVLEHGKYIWARRWAS